jgi:hypothetical protein
MAPRDVLAKSVEVWKQAGPINPEVIEVISDVRKVRIRDHDLLHSRPKPTIRLHGYKAGAFLSRIMNGEPSLLSPDSFANRGRDETPRASLSEGSFVI